MQQKVFPVIDPIATGKNIVRLRQERGLSVRDLQAYFGFEEPQAIYKWQWGKTMPSVDNLYALATLFEVPMDTIIVPNKPNIDLIVHEQQASACCSAFSGCFGYGKTQECIIHFAKDYIRHSHRKKPTYRLRLRCPRTA